MRSLVRGWPPRIVTSDDDKRVVIEAFERAEQKKLRIDKCYIEGIKALINKHSNYRYEYAAKVATQIILDYRFSDLLLP